MSANRLVLPYSALVTLCASLGASACVVVSDDDGDTGASSAGSTGIATQGTTGSSDADSDADSDGTSGTSSASGDATSSASSPGSGSSSAGPTTDPTSAGTGTDGTGSESDGAMGGGTIDVTLSGCAVDLGGTVVVSYNGSLGVASIYDNGGTLSGSFQFDLTGAGTMTLSTQHRVDTGNVINLVDPAQGTWTNIDDDALTGGIDSITGTLTVTTWNPSAGESAIEFDGVTLQSVVDSSDCTIDGTIETTELYP